MNSGWIKLYRKLKEWEWYQKSEMVHLFIHLLVSANHRDGHWQGIKVSRGQLITGLNSLNSETSISLQSLRTCIKRLKSTGEITVKSTNKYSIVTLCNYDSYNDEINETNNQTNSQNNKQLTVNQHSTNNKQEEKEYKNEKNNRGKHLFSKSIYFDIDILKKEIGVKYEKYDLGYYHESAKLYSESKGAMYKNWKSTIQNWIRKDENEGKAKYKKRSNQLFAIK